MAWTGPRYAVGTFVSPETLAFLLARERLLPSEHRPLSQYIDAFHSDVEKKDSLQFRFTNSDIASLLANLNQLMDRNPFEWYMFSERVNGENMRWLLRLPWPVDAGKENIEVVEEVVFPGKDSFFPSKSERKALIKNIRASLAGKQEPPFSSQALLSSSSSCSFEGSANTEVDKFTRSCAKGDILGPPMGGEFEMDMRWQGCLQEGKLPNPEEDERPGTYESDSESESDSDSWQPDDSSANRVIKQKYNRRLQAHQVDALMTTVARLQEFSDRSDANEIPPASVADFGPISISSDLHGKDSLCGTFHFGTVYSEASMIPGLTPRCADYEASAITAVPLLVMVCGMPYVFLIAPRDVRKGERVRMARPISKVAQSMAVPTSARKIAAEIDVPKTIRLNLEVSGCAVIEALLKTLEQNGKGLLDVLHEAVPDLACHGKEWKQAAPLTLSMQPDKSPLHMACQQAAASLLPLIAYAYHCLAPSNERDHSYPAMVLTNWFTGDIAAVIKHVVNCSAAIATSNVVLERGCRSSKHKDHTAQLVFPLGDNCGFWWSAVSRTNLPALDTWRHEHKHFRKSLGLRIFRSVPPVCFLVAKTKAAAYLPRECPFESTSMKPGPRGLIPRGSASTTKRKARKKKHRKTKKHATLRKIVLEYLYELQKKGKLTLNKKKKRSRHLPASETSQSTSISTSSSPVSYSRSSSLSTSRSRASSSSTSSDFPEPQQRNSEAPPPLPTAAHDSDGDDALAVVWRAHQQRRAEALSTSNNPNPAPVADAAIWDISLAVNEPSHPLEEDGQNSSRSAGYGWVQEQDEEEELFSAMEADILNQVNPRDSPEKWNVEDLTALLCPDMALFVVDSEKFTKKRWGVLPQNVNYSDDTYKFGAGMLMTASNSVPPLLLRWQRDGKGAIRVHQSVAVAARSMGIHERKDVLVLGTKHRETLSYMCAYSGWSDSRNKRLIHNFTKKTADAIELTPPIPLGSELSVSIHVAFPPPGVGAIRTYLSDGIRGFLVIAYDHYFGVIGERSKGAPIIAKLPCGQHVGVRMNMAHEAVPHQPVDLEWLHFIVVWKDEETRFYVNGYYIGSVKVPLPSHLQFIGCDQPGVNCCGPMADFVLWNRALTEQEISLLMKRPVTEFTLTNKPIDWFLRSAEEIAPERRVK